ncbi:MAG: DUF3179 domain-containing protein [Acidimicrobiia bacterium]
MRFRVAAVAIAVTAAACGSSDPEASGPSGDTSPSEVESADDTIEIEQIPGGPREDVPSALDDATNDAFPPPRVDVDQIISGGPPPDGIPPIDEPRFVRPAAVRSLADQEPVIAFELDGEARAYPLEILTWHEIVNDTVASVPVAVTYCPLCNTAVVYDRRLGDRVLDFGTSGKLYQSALVMYDRQTESLWAHFTAEGLVGVLAGERLETYPASIVSWASWGDAHPDGLVLSRETGFDRDYGRNPYPGYDDVDRQPFLFRGEVDGRLAAMERVVAVGRDTDPAAIRLDELSDAGVVELTVDGDRVTVWHLPGTGSALDDVDTANGRDIGATGVFPPHADGRMLTFKRDSDAFVDHETGSRWDIFGTAVDGPLAGQRLEPVEHVDTFWFAWAAYQPDTRIEP